MRFYIGLPISHGGDHRFRGPAKYAGEQNSAPSYSDGFATREYLSSETEEYREVLTALIARPHLRLKVNVNGETRADSLNFQLLASDIDEK